ncbi:MAG: histidinol-phosphate transaminase [Gaiellaceae bacterium]
MSDGTRFGRPSLDHLPPGDPATPFADGVALLGLNEGLDGPFPSALAAIEALLPELQRYPNRGSHELVAVLAARHGVAPSQVLVAAGADAVIGYVCQAVLEPGDEVVVPWPSFPSFVRDSQKRDAIPVTVPLLNDQIDLAAMRAAITSRTRLLFVANPNNPTGLAVARGQLIEFVRGLPEHVLPVIDEAYFDYLDPADRLDSIDDLVCDGQEVLVLRTFSKLYGLAGLRVGYGVGPAGVVAAMRKVQRGYDVNAPAQVAALASLDDPAEVERRRGANAAAIRALTELLRARGLEPLAGSVTNFVLVEVSVDADELAATLLSHGVSVQSGAPFGAPTAVRIGAGSPADLERLDAVLAAVLSTAAR